MKYFGHLPLEKRLIGTSLRPTHFSINEFYLWITGITWLVTCQLRYSCLVREGRDILSFIETGERSTRKEKRHKNDGKYYFLKLISFLLSLVTCKYVSFIFLYMKDICICIFMYPVDYKWMLKCVYNWTTPKAGVHISNCTISVCLFHYYHSAWLVYWLSDILQLAETKSTEPYTILLWHILHFFHHLQEIIQCFACSTAKAKYTDGKNVCVD